MGSSMQPESKRRALLLVVLIALLAGLGAFRFWPSKDQDAGQSKGSAHQYDATPAVRVAIHDAQRIGNKELLGNAEILPSNASDAAEARHRKLRILTVGATGVCIGNVGLRIFAVGTNVGPTDLKVLTDTSGKIDLEIDDQASSVRVSVDDSQWHGNAVTVSNSDWPTTLTVAVNRLVSVTFSVQYEDGELFTGRVVIVGGAGGRPVREGSDDIRGGSSEWSGFNMTQSPQTIDDIQSCETTLRFETTRPGYMNHSHTVSASEMVEGALIQIVIPKSTQPIGDLLFVISNPEALEEEWIIDLTHLESPGFSQERRAKRAEADGGYTLRKLAAGPYVVRVRSGARLWLSELTITMGETTTASVTLHETGTLSLTILDEDGVPISGGVLHMRANDLVDYPAVGRTGVLAVSNRDGVARLEGCQSGEAAYVVEAYGYEPVQLRASVSPGVENSAGTVRLKRATGSIVVTLTGGEEGRQYKVALRAPYGNGGRSTERTEFSGAVVTFAALPVREYMVYAYPVGGGTAANAHVVLTPELGEANVTLDLSKLKAHKPVK